MRIYFVRHGIAEDLSSSDFARELTKRGRVRLATAAKVMKRVGLRPSVILTSPRLRSLQTAEIIAAELKVDVTVNEAVNFGFNLSDVQALTDDMTYDDEVMFVGHNPDMSELVNEMTGADVAMKKGGLARVDVYDRNTARGELVWLIAPKVFDGLRKQSSKTARGDEIASAILPDKPAVTHSSLHGLIRRRWSPVSFDPMRPIEKSKLLSILEAARWAASSYNLQPWRFIVAPRGNKHEFEKVWSVLKEGNQSWAKQAGVLMIAVSQTHRDTGEPNSHAFHDLGLAIGQMVLQALDHDIYAHQMGGFYPEKARELYRIPANYEPKTAIAFGYRASDLSRVSDAQRERDASQRQRSPLAEMVFNGAWARRASFLD
ncbi:MAG: phosphohistidine phosphatase SixA [Chloroflexi bacterium]|nr:phosphohistidine phosphatase SixA [Chloroflexota bacterium]